MSLGEGTLYALIVGCEVAFWVALFSGLAFRYLFRWSRVSSFVLWCVPLIDVALLAFTVLDLRAVPSQRSHMVWQLPTSALPLLSVR